MKKVGILTINDDNNYGNRLQNYATQEILKKRNMDVTTILNIEGMKGINFWKRKIKNVIKRFLIMKPKFKRYSNFIRFNKGIKQSFYIIGKDNIPSSLAERYDYFITGSDQVWNPEFGKMTEIDFLEFAPKQKRNSLSASFGIGELPEETIERAKKGLKGLNHISVREERGKEIITELTGRQDVEVLVDPTMMLDAKEWTQVAKKPKMLKSKKYILNYFLGELGDDRRKEIERIAEENDCEIINILDKESPFYVCGPSEFVYLEKNAFLICTDSFHSCVFAILFEKPFVIFERRQNKVSSMNSRLDTLLKKFSLEDRYYKGKLEKTHLEINYEETNKILRKEREKFQRFLDKVFERENKNDRTS